MKASLTRIIHRRRRSSADGTFFKKENNSEQSFFAEPAHESFFHHAQAEVQRKCDTCEEEEKTLQRKPVKEEEEKKLQRLPDKKEEEEKKKVLLKPDVKKEEDKKLQRVPEKKEEEEKKLQKKSKEEVEKLHLKKGNTQPAAAINTSAYINTLHGKGSALPKNIQHFFQSRIGHDFSAVKIHTGPDAEASAKEVNAKAYAFENHIVFNKGEYDPATRDGKKLLAHELVHTIQQGSAALSKKEKDEPQALCTAGSVDLEAETTAGFAKNAGSVVNEKTKKIKGCTDCEDECVNITGTLKVPFKASTKIILPAVPGNLTPCQLDRVRAAINGPLLKHEKQHVKAFETFDGTASLAINFKGCESDYSSFQENLAEQEFQRRKSFAEAKSAALDPFTVPVDLCCTEKPKK